MAQAVNPQNVTRALDQVSRFLPNLSSIQQELLELVVPIHEQGKKLVKSLTLLETTARVMFAENKQQELVEVVAREAEESRNLIGKLIPELAELRERHTELMERFKAQESVIKMPKEGLTQPVIELVARYERARDFHLFYIKEDVEDIVKMLSALNKKLENGFMHEGKLWNGYFQVDERYRNELLAGFTNLFKIIEAIGKEMEDLKEGMKRLISVLVKAY